MTKILLVALLGGLIHQCTGFSASTANIGGLGGMGMACWCNSQRVARYPDQRRGARHSVLSRLALEPDGAGGSGG